MNLYQKKRKVLKMNFLMLLLYSLIITGLQITLCEYISIDYFKPNLYIIAITLFVIFNSTGNIIFFMIIGGTLFDIFTYNLFGSSIISSVIIYMIISTMGTNIMKESFITRSIIIVFNVFIYFLTAYLILYLKGINKSNVFFQIIIGTAIFNVIISNFIYIVHIQLSNMFKVKI